MCQVPLELDSYMFVALKKATQESAQVVKG